MRIAYLANPTMSGGFYRAIGPMTALAQVRGHMVRALSTDDERPPLAAVRDVDVLHIHRFADERAQLLAREAKAAGAAVVWDNDDDMGSVPKGTPAYRVHGGVRWEQRLTGMRKIFRLADLVTAPSRTLVERLRALGAPHAEVIENHVPDQFLHARSRPHTGITIGWIAGLEHQLDTERIPIVSVLQQLLDERDDVNVLTFGLGLGLRSERYRSIDVVPLLELRERGCRLRRRDRATRRRRLQPLALQHQAEGVRGCGRSLARLPDRPVCRTRRAARRPPRCRRRVAQRPHPPAREAARASQARKARDEVGHRRDALQARSRLGGALHGSGRAGARCGYVVRMISTEQGAWWETLFGTEPSRKRFAPVMPLLPTMIRSLPCSSATSRIASAGSP